MPVTSKPTAIGAAWIFHETKINNPHFIWIYTCESFKKLGFIFIALAHTRKANIVFNIWGLLKFDDNKIHNLIAFLFAPLSISISLSPLRWKILLNLFWLFCRTTGNWLSNLICCALHKLLLWWAVVSWLLCWHGNTLSRWTIKLCFYKSLSTQLTHKLLIDFHSFFSNLPPHHRFRFQDGIIVVSWSCLMQLAYTLMCSLILDIDGRQATFLCPNGTQFSQAVFVCDWWFNVRCDLSPRLYSINARLYQRPKVNPTKPHRIITKELVEDIFNK
jgi:hypothetical protein